jgi:CRP-like cAMP-binding protein
VASGILRRYPAGSLILAEGDPGGDVLAILAGEVVVTVGLAETAVSTIGPGELLGELAALDGLPRSASAWAVTEVEAVAVPAPTFVSLVARFAPDAMPLLSMESRRTRLATEWRAADGGGVPVTHLAGCLLARLDEDATGDVALALDPAVLSQELGTSRELLTRALEFLAGRGAVAWSCGSLVVLDRAALAAAAQARAARSSS